jgi:hypothetical protein
MMFAAQFVRYLPSGTMSRIRAIIGPDLADWVVRRVAGTIPNRLVQVRDGRRFRVGPDPIFYEFVVGENSSRMRHRLCVDLSEMAIA